MSQTSANLVAVNEFSAGRSSSSVLDAYALSMLLWNDDDSEGDVEDVDHILTDETTPDLASGTRKNIIDDEDGTDNPDETEVDGLIDTFEVELPERSFTRIASWRASVVRPTEFDFVNKRKGTITFSHLCCLGPVDPTISQCYHLSHLIARGKVHQYAHNYQQETWQY